MRRFVPACIFLFALSAPLRADKVPPQKAAAVAERFLSAESPATKASGTPLRLRGN